MLRVYRICLFLSNHRWILPSGRQPSLPITGMHQNLEAASRPRGCFQSTLWHLAVLTILLAGLATETTAQETTDSNDASIPEYDFEEGPVRDWLILGPIARGEEFENPVEHLETPQPGKQVTLKDGSIREWKSFRADSTGLVPLIKVHEEYQASVDEVDEPYRTSNHLVFYAWCQIRADTSFPRQVLLGMDDGGRAWVNDKLVIDDVAADWLTLYEHAIPIPQHESGRRDLLLEVHNWTGTFKFQCYGGNRLKGRLVLQDKATPVADESVNIKSEGQTLYTVLTDASGRFDIPAVPYGSSVEIEACQSRISVAPPNNQDFNSQEDRLQFEVAPHFDLSITRDKLAIRDGIYDAMVELRDGTIVIASRTENTLHLVQGKSTRRHPHPSLQNFTTGIVANMVETEDGCLWIGTHGDGVFCFDGDKLFHWPADEMGQRNHLLTVDENDNVWASFQLDSQFANHAIYRFADKNSAPEKIDIGNAAAFWDALPRTSIDGESEFLMIPRFGNIFVLSDKGQHRLKPPVNCEIADAAKDAEGNIWMAGNGLYRLAPDNEWTHFPVPQEDLGVAKRSVECGPNGEIWFVTSNAVYCKVGGFMKRTAMRLTDSREVHTCMSRTGQLYLTESSGGVQYLTRSNQVNYDHTFGLTSRRAIYLSKGADGILCSFFGSEPKLIKENGFEAPDFSALGEQAAYYFETTNPFTVMNLQADCQLVVPAFHAASGNTLNTTQRPMLKDREGNWKQLKCSSWTSEVQTYCCGYQLRNGRVFIASIQGLAELIDDQLVPSDLCGEYSDSGTPLAIYEDSAGTIWIVLCSGYVIRREGDDVTQIQFPTKTHCSGTVVAEYNNAVWVGNSSGLFRLTKDGKDIQCISHPAIRNQPIVGLETNLIDGQLWAISNRGTAYTTPDGEHFSRLTILPSNTHVHINATEVDDHGRLWLATQSGLSSYRPTRIAPQVYLDAINGNRLPLSQSARKKNLETQIGSTTNYQLVSKDDRSSGGIRYRINKGLWIYPDSSLTEPVQIRASDAGEKEIEFQAYDGSWNLSNIESIREDVYVPWLEKPGVQLALISLMLTALCSGIYLFYQIVIHRRASSRLKDKLLKEESRARVIAEESNNERALLLARVCHDIRSPLSVVSLVRDCLEAELDEDERQEVVKLLDRSAKSMTYLTDQLLTYARSRTCAIHPKLTPTSILEFANTFESVARAKLASTPLSFELEMQNDLPQEMSTDPELLNEILDNIFENALRHTSKGKIKLSCQLFDQKTLEWVMTDTGQGMPPDVVDAIFQPFFKGEREDNPQNVGMGMYIVQELTRALSGRAEVESRVTKGTVVRVRLPLQPELKSQEDQDRPDQEDKDSFAA